MIEESWPSLEEFEAKVKVTTLANHKKEINLVEKLLNHYLTGFNKLGKLTLSENNELEYAWLLLTT